MWEYLFYKQSSKRILCYVIGLVWFVRLLAGLLKICMKILPEIGSAQIISNKGFGVNLNMSLDPGTFGRILYHYEKCRETLSQYHKLVQIQISFWIQGFNSWMVWREFFNLGRGMQSWIALVE